MLFSEVFQAAVGFPVLFLLCRWLLWCFWLLRIARGLVGVALAVCVLGSAGRRRGGLFARSSCSCAVYVASVERAFWWRSGGDPQLVVIEIGVT